MGKGNAYIIFTGTPYVTWCSWICAS